MSNPTALVQKLWNYCNMGSLAPARSGLAKLLPASARYRLLHHDSKSNFDLQIADYCTWAIYRKWNSGDVRSYQHIQPAVKSEFDIFRTGQKFYY